MPVSSESEECEILHTPGLIYLAIQAAQKNKNRAVKREFIDQIDPNGRHVVAMKMPHNDVEWRLHILCKILGSDDPVDIWLDADFDDFEGSVERLPWRAIQDLREVQDSLKDIKDNI